MPDCVGSRKELMEAPGAKPSVDCALPQTERPELMSPHDPMLLLGYRRNPRLHSFLRPLPLASPR
jgi:hypothetical protein